MRIGISFWVFKYAIVFSNKFKLVPKHLELSNSLTSFITPMDFNDNKKAGIFFLFCNFCTRCVNACEIPIFYWEWINDIDGYA